MNIRTINNERENKMKWESELVWKGNRRVWRYGLKHKILTALIWVGLIVFLVGLYFLNTFRWTI